MHAQAGDRSCASEAIGGAHYGPVLVYMSKVADAATADGSSSFFKIFQDTWAKKSTTSQGSDDYWGTKDLNSNCGKMDVVVPKDLAPGDYLLRAEAIALHSAAGAGGAQFYVT
jgi:cellulase